MADSLGDIIVRFIADATGLVEGTTLAEGVMETFGEAITGLAGGLGIAFSAYELLKDSLGDFANIQKAEIALTALTGDAEGAATTIDNLRQMAISEGLDFPALVQADQRMTALGFSADQTATSLQSIADVAAATNTDVGTAASAFDRLVESGNASGRTLIALGLNLGDLAKVMGVSESQATELYKALGDTDRIDVANLAIQKFAGQAKDAADTLTGQWKTAADEFGASLELIGKTLAPVGTAVLTFLTATAGLLDTALTKLGAFATALAQVGGTAFSGEGFTGTTQTGTFVDSVIPKATPGTVGGLADNGDTIGGTGGALSSTAEATKQTMLLTDALKDAQSQLSLVTTAYNQGAASSDQLAVATAGVHNAFLDLHPEFQNMTPDVNVVDALWKSWTTDLQGTAASMNDFGDTFVDSADRIPDALVPVTDALTGVTFQVGTSTQGWQDWYTQSLDTVQQLQTIALGLPAVLQGLQDQADQLPTNTTNATNLDKALQGLSNNGIKSIASNIPDALGAAGQFHDQLGLAKDALVLLSQSETDGATDADTLKSAFNDLGQQTTTTLDQLATAADQAYKDILQSGTASSEQLRTARISDLTTEEQAMVAHGQTLTTADQLTLAQLTQQQKDFTADQVKAWGTLYSSIDTDVQNVASSMIATLFTGSGSFHDEAIKGLEEIGEAVVTKFTKPFTDAVANLISGAITDLLSGKGLGGIETALSGIGTSFQGLFSSASSSAGATNGGLPTLGGTLTSATSGVTPPPGVSSGAGGAASALSSLGSVADVANIVGAVAAVGSGITAGLQAATTNDHLFHIMSDTAYMKGYLLDIDTHAISTDLGISLLQQILYDPIHSDLVGIWGELQDGVHAQLTQLYTDVTGSLKQLVGFASVAQAPAQIIVNTNGPVISVPDFANQVASIIANTLKLQGVPV